MRVYLLLVGYYGQVAGVFATEKLANDEGELWYKGDYSVQVDYVSELG